MNNDGLNSVGVLILAAGLSERMGTPKPFLKFDNKISFIEQIINVYLEFGCSRITVSIDENKKDWMKTINKYKSISNIQFIVNHHPEYERFYSIKIGLLEMFDVNYCFIQNVDNPFVSKTTLVSLFTRRKGNSFIVPNFNGKGGHPILLGDDIINHILSIDKLSSNMKDVLRECQRIDCNVNDESIFININNQSEYNKYFGISK